jgi:hypothetical protein
MVFDLPGSWGVPTRELYRCYQFPRTDIIPEIVHELLRLWGLPVGPTSAMRSRDCTGANGPAEPQQTRPPGTNPVPRGRPM